MIYLLLFNLIWVSPSGNAYIIDTLPYEDCLAALAPGLVCQVAGENV